MTTGMHSTPGAHKMTFKRPAAMDKIQTILTLLRAVPMTDVDLAELIPMSRKWTREYLKHLHRARRVYVHSWAKDATHRDKRHAIPIWSAGRRPDAQRPDPDSRSEVFRRAWVKLKADPERHTSTLARRRVQHRLKNLRPDPAAAWLMTPMERS